MVLCLTGCTKQLKGPDGKVVINSETGQQLPSNVLCAPTDEDILKLYKENKENLEKAYKKQLDDGDISKKDYEKKVSEIVDVEKMQSCKSFNILGDKNGGIWTTFFVRPLSLILIKVGEFLKNYGLAIILVTLLIRLIMYPITLKTARQSENLKKAQPEIEKIERKYQNKQDQDSINRKAQETMLVYKKYNISPMSGCLFSMIQLPLFIAFFEAVQRIPAIFEGKFLGLQLGTTPIVGFGTNGIVVYIILMLLIAATTFYSFKLNMAGNSLDANMKMMPMMMSGMIIVMGLFMPSALGIYWITTNVFTIIQNLLVKRSKDKHGKA